MKLIITGGHITPAIAVFEECKKRNIDVVFVGRAYSYNKNEKTMEAKMLENVGAKLIHIDAGRFTRVANLTSIKHLTKVPKGLIQAINLLIKERPDAVLSFGGYIGLAVSISAKLLNVPVYIHEQVLVPGTTNRIIAKFAKKIFISFSTSAKYFPDHKVVLTGNPVREGILKVKSMSINIKTKRPILFITGGSLGAHAINRHIEILINRIKKIFYIVHQTGNVSQYRDYERLKKMENENYKVFEHLSEEDMGYMLNVADVVISRSGANTVFELLAIKKPAVLVPLPFASYKEQEEHAKLLSDAGCAKIFYQEHRSEELLEAINFIIKNKVEMRNNFKTLSSLVHLDSAKRIIDEIV